MTTVSLTIVKTLLQLQSLPSLANFGLAGGKNRHVTSSIHHQIATSPTLHYISR